MNCSLQYEEAQMNKIRFPKILSIGLLVILTACQAAGQPSSAAMLKPGDTIDGMSLTTGAVDVPPLWAFCSPGQHSGNTTSSECNVPVLPRLGIGHLFMVSDDTLSDLDWSELTWQLFIDDQPVDLEAFGTLEYIMPAISKSPSPVREVFKSFTAWDVVLTDLSPGEHTIHAFAQMGSDSYHWVIHLTIQGNDLGTGTPWVGPEVQEVS
jgi:hypothetical protein